ncbi:Defense protein l(2)34Fc [Geodia barretti]|uniref:Defense protein l(2)34Fc n=1 Tax=Geodia barretti TaxID=519541 RepID=A0AA35TC85_GEOBA|nr:Defense protein l(2)34Fc [Geodia barretti]
MSLAASVLVLLLACLYAADARPEGAPAGACTTLTPESPHAANGQTTPVPYEIDLTMFEDDNGTLQYTPGRVYTLTFRRMGGVTFRGFFVRARLAADDSFLTNAPFAMIDSEIFTRTSSCTPANSGITHNNAARADLIEVQFQWTAPPEGTGTIFFGFAVVQTRDVYWANQMSAMLEEEPAGSGANDPCYMSPCAENANCESNDGSYECECMSGYDGDGITNCYDVNECESEDYCQSEYIRYCNNTVGGYSCTCYGGYFYSFAADDCIEIDSDEPYRAPALEVPGCNEELNAYLRYYLRERMEKAGIAALVLFSVIALTKQSISDGSGANDPCYMSPCAENANCESNDGSYECECMSGYDGDGITNCYDVNECDESEDYCQSEYIRYCNNTVGGYSCTCIGGYFYSFAADDCIEIDSDEPYRAPALEVPGCNEELNAYLRYYLRERVQQFLAEYVEYTGLSTGSGSESYTD